MKAEGGKLRAEGGKLRAEGGRITVIPQAVETFGICALASHRMPSFIPCPCPCPCPIRQPLFG
jgi:hypothetical protein